MGERGGEIGIYVRRLRDVIGLCLFPVRLTEEHSLWIDVLKRAVRGLSLSSQLCWLDDWSGIATDQPMGCVTTSQIDRTWRY